MCVSDLSPVYFREHVALVGPESNQESIPGHQTHTQQPLFLWRETKVRGCISALFSSFVNSARDYTLRKS